MSYVPQPESVLADIALLWRRAGQERDRAARAATLAARYDASQHGSRQIWEVRARMAALHRRIEQRHLTTARLHELHAIRMECWLGRPGTLQPVFMAAVASALGVDGTVAMLRTRRYPVVAVTASDELAQAAHDLEAVLGEGPGATAMAAGASVQATGDSLPDRWPLYGQAVAKLGIRAVVAVPMRIPSRCLGALCTYDTKPAIDDHAASATERIADALTHMLIDTIPPDGGPGWPLDLLDQDAEATVHQAIGMLSVYRECAAADAEAMLRARAFVDNRPLLEVALDVIEGRSRLALARAPTPLISTPRST